MINKNIIRSIFFILFPVLILAQDNVWLSYPIYGGDIYYGEIAPSSPDSLIIVTSIANYKTTDGGATWSDLSIDGLATQNVRGIYIHPSYADSLFLVGHSALTVSGDFGNSWSYNALPAELRTPRRHAISPTRTKTVYVPDNYWDGVNGEGKLYKTSDLGVNWEVVLDRAPDRLQGVSISQQNPDKVYAAYVDSIFRSDNGGTSWLNITNNFFDVVGAAPYDIFVSPYDDDLIVIFTLNSIAELYISYDGGTNWVMRDLPEFDWSFAKYITFSPDNQSIYVASKQTGLYESTDRGDTWNLLSTPGLVNQHFWKILLNPTDTDTRFLLTEGSGVYKTIDAGVNWNPFNFNVSEVNVISMAESPQSVNNLLAASSTAGIFRTINAGSNWAPSNNGLLDANIVKIAWPSNNPDNVFAISEVSGVYVSDNDGASWTPSNTGATLDTYYDLIYDSLNSRLYAAGDGGTSDIIYSDNWGADWQYFDTPPIIPRKIAYNPLNDLLYAGTSIAPVGLYKYESGNWIDIAGADLLGLGIYSITPHPSNADSLYVYANDKYVYASGQGGSVWNSIYYVPSGNIFIQVRVDPLQTHIIYISDNYVIKSFDAGSTYIDFPTGAWGSAGCEISIHDRQTIFSKTRNGLQYLHQAPVLSAPSLVDVGAVALGANSSGDVIFENDGFAILNLADFTIGGTHSTHWQLADNQPVSMIYQQQDTVSVIFEPDSVGSLAAMLTGSSNDPLNTTWAVDLNGQALGALLSFENTLLNFGDVYYQTPQDSFITINNVGNADLTISSSSISGANAEMFAITAGGGEQVIESSGSLQVSIQFTPSGTGSYSGSLDITSDDAYNAVHSLNLSGNGVVADIDLAGTASVNFGTVFMGGFLDQGFQIQNIGSAVLQVDSIVIGDSAFTVLSPAAPFQVAGGTSQQVSLRFFPSEVKTYNTELSIYSNDPDENPFTITLTGIGSSVPTGTLNLSQNSHDFGDILVGQISQQWELVISNSSSLYDFQIDSMTVDDSAFTINDTLTLPYQMNTDFAFPLHLFFSPDSVKNYESLLTIYSNASNGTQQINLSGVGTITTGTIEVSADVIDFGTVLIDSTSDAEELSISNTSSEYAIIIDSIQVEPQEFQFNLSQSLPFILSPQQMLDINLDFTPVDSIFYSGNLSIYSDASNNDLRIISLSGHGKTPEPPALTFNPDQISALEGNSSAISITIESDLSIEYARIYFSPGGLANYDSLPMTTGDGINFSATIPSDRVQQRGLTYYFKISDSQYVLRHPETGVFNLAVNIANIDKAIITDGAYQMISLPMKPDDPSPLSVIGDNLGEYDILNWRMFRWINNSYIELNDQEDDIGDFSPGRAFWLAAKSASTFNTGSGTSTPVAEPITLNLQEGWNQIGSPYLFTLDWSDVIKIGQVSEELWYYNTADNEYILGSSLNPWEGYFIRALDAGSSLSFVPQEAALPKQVVHGLEKSEWQIRIFARAGKAKDRYNYIGMKKEAEDEYDRYDFGEPPAISEYVSVYFPHQDWKESGNYSSDFRAPQQRGSVWTMQLDTDIKKGEIELTFINEAVPDNFETWLVDKALRMPLNLNENNIHRFRLRKEENIRDFDILVGEESYIENSLAALDLLPGKLTLYPNFPNPFNPETNIKFYLPDEQDVQMDIFNILGQKVNSSIPPQRMGRGFHSVLWDGTNDRGTMMPSGMYFVILRANSDIKTHKILLLK